MMSPRKEYFDEPLVKVDFLKVRFPKTCPVCGAPATSFVPLKIAKTGKQPLRRSWEYAYAPYPRHRHETKPPEMKVLPIQVCENHAHPDDGTDRYQSLCLIIDGLLIGLVIFGLLIIGDSISRALPLSFWPFLYMLLFAIAILSTKVAFRPNALERAVKIIGFDPGMQNVLILLKRADYRKQFLLENQMNAELVTWILRADD